MAIYTFISDITVNQISNGWGPIELDTSNGEDSAGDGLTLSIRGKTYSKGIGCHAYSLIEIPLNGQFISFMSDIGVDDEVIPIIQSSGNPGGDVIFRVLVDNVLVFTSPTLTYTSPIQTIQIPVNEANLLSLEVLESTTGNGYDHADWANARLSSPQPSPNGILL